MIGKIFPKISTRGFYDLKTGKTLTNTSYEIYPKTSFEIISKKPEISKTEPAISKEYS